MLIPNHNSVNQSLTSSSSYDITLYREHVKSSYCPRVGVFPEHKPLCNTITLVVAADDAEMPEMTMTAGMVAVLTVTTGTLAVLQEGTHAAAVVGAVALLR